MDENHCRDEPGLRRPPRSPLQHPRNPRQGSALRHRPRPHHAFLPDPRRIRLRGGVPLTHHRARPLQRVHTRRKRQRSHEPRRRRKENQKTRRIRQTLPHQVRSRLPLQTRIRRSRTTLRQPPPRRHPRTHQVRTPHHENHGLPRILPHRPGLHQRSPHTPRRQRRPRPRIRSRLMRGLLPRHHTDRPRQVRPPLRTIPQPRPNLTPRYRRRLRRRRPRHSPRLRNPALRRRKSGPHHHLRHNGRQVSHQRRRPRRAAPPPRVEPPRQTRPRPHARRRKRQRIQTHTQKLLPVRPRIRTRAPQPQPPGGRNPPVRQSPRRQRAQHRRTRLRRHHLPRRHHRLGTRLNSHRQKRRQTTRHPVRRPCHRGDRPHQNGLPRPQNPLYPQRGRQKHRAHPRNNPRPRSHPHRRPKDLPAIHRRSHHRHIPVRVSRNAEIPPRAQTLHLRGPHSHERPLPPRPNGLHPRVHQAQARREPHRLRHPRDGEIPQGHLRRHRLPGAGHAPVTPPRQLHTWRVRHPPKGNGQKAHRQDEPPQRQIPRRRPGKRSQSRSPRKNLERLGKVRIIRLQQVTRHMLLLGRIPDSIPQSQLPLRVHGRSPHTQHERHRQTQNLHGRVPQNEHRRPLPRRQRVIRHIRRQQKRRHPIRPLSHQRRRLKRHPRHPPRPWRPTVRRHLRLR